MKILQAPQEKWQELSNNLIVVCQYQTKQGEQVFGIDIMYKTQYPDFVEVEVIDPNQPWHEEDRIIQIEQEAEGFSYAAENHPELAMYRKYNNIPLHRFNGKYYFYLNWLEAEHRALFENPNLKITINEKNS